MSRGTATCTSKTLVNLLIWYGNAQNCRFQFTSLFGSRSWYLHITAFFALPLDPKYFISIWIPWQCPNNKYKGNAKKRHALCLNVRQLCLMRVYVSYVSNKWNELESHLCCYQVATPHLSRSRVNSTFKMYFSCSRYPKMSCQLI